MYTSLSDYLKSEYGEKIYKLSLSSGCTCPNRDGFLSYGGCTFCSEAGSGDFAAPSSMDVHDQIDFAIDKLKNKSHSDKYIAYFQSYTNTYGPIDRLRKLYKEAINDDRILILSIATRPDCLGVEVLEMLDELNKIKPVWVELGLQTTNEKSIEYINRGYDNIVYKEAVENLNKLSIKVITHIILGLPSETYEDMEKSVRFSIECGTWGLKLQLLHVLSGTRLAEDFKNGLFKTLEMDEYIDILARLLQIIPETVVIHRLTGDGPKKLLIAPKWSGNKKVVMNEINKIVKIYKKD